MSRVFRKNGVRCCRARSHAEARRILGVNKVSKVGGRVTRRKRTTRNAGDEWGSRVSKAILG